MDQADPVRENGSGGAGVTRRGFLVATAAGAAAAQGCSSQHPPDDGGWPGPRAVVKRPTCVAAVPGKRAVTSDDDGKVFLWDTEPVRLADKLKDMRGAKASYVAASTRGRPRVLAATFDGYVYGWDLDPKRSLTRFDGHVAKDVEVWAVAVSADGSNVLSVDNGGLLIHWTIDANGQPREVNRKAGLAHRPIGGIAFVPPDDNKFLTTDSHGLMSLWDLAKLEVTQRFPHKDEPIVNSVAVRADGTAVTAGFHKRVTKWDVNAANPSEIQLPTPHRDRLWRVALSSEDVVASADDVGDVHVTDLNGNPLRGSPLNEPNGVMGVAISLDNPRLVIYTTGSSTGTGPLIKTVRV